MTDTMRGVRRRMAMTWELVPFLFTPPVRDLVMVTGADSTHFRSLIQFLSSLLQHEHPTAIVAYDLGLRPEEHHQLAHQFPQALLRTFDYSPYPSYFNIQVEAGQYAWKPVIISSVVEEFRSAVCWMDAGNVVTSRLIWLRKILRSVGMYSPRSKGTIRDWTHPLTLAYLGAGADLLDRWNLSGLCVALDYRSDRAMTLLDHWKNCALSQDCIAPPGSSRRNHRQDQAVLSVLGHQMGLTARMPIYCHGFEIQRDVG